jgi:hypothetical protein
VSEDRILMVASHPWDIAGAGSKSGDAGACPDAHVRAHSHLHARLACGACMCAATPTRRGPSTCLRRTPWWTASRS